LTADGNRLFGASRKIEVGNNRGDSLVWYQKMIEKDAHSLAQNLISIGDFGMHSLQLFVYPSVFRTGDETQVEGQRLQRTEGLPQLVSKSSQYVFRNATSYGRASQFGIYSSFGCCLFKIEHTDELQGRLMGFREMRNG
jgi:hypothetical protein